MTLVGKVMNEPERPKPGPKCGVGQLRSTLESEGKTEEAKGLVDLIEAVRRSRNDSPYMNTGGWTGASVHRVLIEEGYRVSLLTLQRHISRMCACGW